jgi:hypothetical protein
VGIEFYAVVRSAVGHVKDMYGAHAFSGGVAQAGFGEDYAAAIEFHYFGVAAQAHALVAEVVSHNANFFIDVINIFHFDSLLTSTHRLACRLAKPAAPLGSWRIAALQAALLLQRIAYTLQSVARLRLALHPSAES